MLDARIDRITGDVVEALRFPGSSANANNALRTLRRMLHKAGEWKLLAEVPRFKLFKEAGRALRLDDEAERKLLPHAKQQLRDIIVLMRDTGMRNQRELYCMRVESMDVARKKTTKDLQEESKALLEEGKRLQAERKGIRTVALNGHGERIDYSPRNRMAQPWT